MWRTPKVQPTRIKLRINIRSFALIEFTLLGKGHLGINVNAKVNGGKHVWYDTTFEDVGWIGREKDNIIAQYALE